MRRYHANPGRTGETIHVASNAAPADEPTKETTKAAEANRSIDRSNGEGVGILFIKPNLFAI